MSYFHAASLQQAIYERLTQDTDVSDLVGSHIFDHPPTDAVPVTYVVIGAEDARDQSDQTGTGSIHKLTLSIITREAGFLEVKQVSAVIARSLHQAALQMQTGRLVSLIFQTARARRIENGLGRQVDLQFRARVDDDN